MDGFEKARKIIDDSRRNRPRFIFCIGPTGATGGPTGPTGPTG